MAVAVPCQWKYMTANTCLPPGYSSFFGDRSDLATWWSRSLSSCGGNAAYPEEFWKCVRVCMCECEC